METVMTNEKRLAANKVGQSLDDDCPTLKNFAMAVKRLNKTEKRLLCQKNVGQDYAKIILIISRKDISMK